MSYCSSDAQSAYLPDVQMPGTDSGNQALVELAGYGVAFGSRTILVDVTMTLPRQGIVVLMGPAGTGKSTLLAALAGNLASKRREWGSIRLSGVEPEKSGWCPALVQQRPRDFLLPVFDCLASGPRSIRQWAVTDLRTHISQVLRELELDELVDQFATPVIDLEPASARLVAIVRAALTDSPLLLIDEPTTGIPAASVPRMLDVIRRIGRGRCCFVVLHNQAHARAVADRVVLIAGGHVQADAPVDAFFLNREHHPVLGQFLRTGSCYVPSPDAMARDLDPDVVAPAHAGSANASCITGGDEPAEAKASETVPSLPQPVHADVPERAPEGPAPSSAQPPIARGPNGFHWLIPGKLAGCPMPGVIAPLDYDLALLKGAGITTLVNLTERKLPEEALARYGMHSYLLTIEDRKAPPLLWAKMLLKKMDAMFAAGEVVAVHCLAGLGRTGTVLGAWLVREGLTAGEALRRLRSIDAGFVQSQEQEDLLHELETNLLIRAGS